MILIAMLNTISTRDLQRTPRDVIYRAQKSDKPLIVISGNKPMGAFINLHLLDRLQKILKEENKIKSTKTLLDIAGLVKEGYPIDLSAKHDTYAWE